MCVKKQRVFIRIWLILLCLTIFVFQSRAQVGGQYEDEAPFRSWNTFGIKTASSLGFGETIFSKASDCSVALTNPALLLKLPNMSLILNGSMNTASLFKYSFVNTGVISTQNSVFGRYLAFDFVGLSLRFGNWAFALSWGEIENYRRPRTRQEYVPQDTVVYFLALDQRGSLNNVNFSISRKLFKNVTFGVGVNYVYGDLRKDITEEFLFNNISRPDSVSHLFTGFYLNGGLSIDITDKFTFAAVFRTPYVKKAESQRVLGYYAPDVGTDKTIETFSKSTFNLPLVIGAGISFEISRNLFFASDLTFFNWSSYSIDCFEEPLQRDFKNVVKIGAGLEFWDSLKLFKQKIIAPTRIGIVYDPQPMKEPNSSYFYLSIGSGLYWKKIFLDVGTLIGREWGSGNALKAVKVAISLRYEFNTMEVKK